MSQCDPGSCQHLMALKCINENFLVIQNENINLKKEILRLKSEKESCSSNEDGYYQRWLDTNSENHELNNKLTDSRQMVAELKPKLTQVLQSIQNIEQVLSCKKRKQEDDSKTADTSLLTNNNSTQLVQYVENVNNKHQTVESGTGSKEIVEVIEQDMDSATDTEDQFLSNPPVETSFSEPCSSLTNPDPVSNSAASQVVPYGMNQFMDYPNIPEEKPTISECSICHENFPNYTRSDVKMFQGPPCCDKCRSPATTSSSSRGITFQYPKGGSTLPFDLQTEYQSGDLSARYTRHVDDKPYQCQMCGKKFTRSHGLKKHIRIHTGEKPYSCKICGKSFAVSGRLALHIRIHTGEKPHECKFCGKRFNESSKLRIHYRKHTGEKPFTCEVCDKGFSQMSTLTTHCRRHLTETRNKCDKCGNGFRTPNALRGHRCLQICDSTLDPQQNTTETILGTDT